MSRNFSSPRETPDTQILASCSPIMYDSWDPMAVNPLGTVSKDKLMHGHP